jgi:hypothetical protein
MICFTASKKPTGGNFDLTKLKDLPDNADLRSAYVTNATDFTKDEYD